MRTLEDDARTGHTATAWNLETIAKVCELVTTHCCMSLKLMENQVQVDFESDILNYCLGPITWNCAIGFWEWCTELLSRTNNLELWRYKRNTDSVGYISACTIHSIRYRLILQISIYLLFTPLSHHALSSYQSLDILMASFLQNLLLKQSVSNFRAKISLLFHYAIYLSDLTN